MSVVYQQVPLINISQSSTRDDTDTIPDPVIEKVGLVARQLIRAPRSIEITTGANLGDNDAPIVKRDANTAFITIPVSWKLSSSSDSLLPATAEKTLEQAILNQEDEYFKNIQTNTDHLTLIAGLTLFFLGLINIYIFILGIPVLLVCKLAADKYFLSDVSHILCVFAKREVDLEFGPKELV